MTGYGRGVADDDGFRAIVEIRAVNHRFLDLKLRGSTLAPAVEERVCNAIREVCQRGSVTAVIRVESRGARAVMRVDLDAARRVHAELSRLADLLRDERDPQDRPRIPIELLCAQPGVLVPQDPDERRETQKQLRQLTSQRDQVTARVEKLEARIHEINEVFCDPTFFERTPHAKVTKMEKEQKDLSGQVDALMGEWEGLEQQIEALEASMA